MQYMNTYIEREGREGGGDGGERGGGGGREGDRERERQSVHYFRSWMYV
jgi:hypothetical protein